MNKSEELFRKSVFEITMNEKELEVIAEVFGV